MSDSPIYDKPCSQFSDVFVIGPRVLRPSRPKVYAYSRGGNPAEKIKFSEISRADGSAAEEEAKCVGVTGVDFLYECTINKRKEVRIIKFNDKKSWI